MREINIKRFYIRKKYLIIIGIITIISLMIRLMWLDFKSMDYISFLEKWFNALKENGGLYALKMDFSDYNAPYLTIMALLTYLPINPLISIKVISIVFDYICAFIVMKIVHNLLKENERKYFWGLIAYGTTLFLPTVILNSSCWGQADSIYSAFVLISIFYLLDEKYIKSFVFLGIAFSFKLQTIFVIPLYILIFSTKEKKYIKYFLIIPLVYIIMCLPAIIFGKSILSCMGVYMTQTMEYSHFLTMNMANVYGLVGKSFSTNLILSSNNYINKIMILLTMLIFGIMEFIVLCKRVEFNKRNIIDFGLWSIMIAVFLLPSMHDRYLYMGDILSIIYCIKNKNKIYIPIGISIISLYGYITYLAAYIIIPMQCVSLLYLILVIIVTKDVLNNVLSSDSKKGYLNEEN